MAATHHCAFLYFSGNLREVVGPCVCYNNIDSATNVYELNNILDVFVSHRSL